MVSRRQTRPSVDNQTLVVKAPTLKEAYRRIKSQFGDDAVILGSRSISQRQSLGLGSEKLVEVTVQAPGHQSQASGHGAAGSGVQGASMTGSAAIPQDIAEEVDRIENLVQTITAQVQDNRRQANAFRDNPLAHALMESGTQPATIEKIMTRFSSETGHEPQDRVAAITWMTENLRASNCEWDGFHGCHAFLGRPGSGRTTMVYAAAAKLQELGRKTLVLAVMPEHTGEVRRLQSIAAELGFDAAVIQDNSQLARSESHLSQYDAVLLDLPAFGHPAMKAGGALHTWLAGHPGFHRHLILPLDSDSEDANDLAVLAREWQADWVAVSRIDLTRRQGKFLDFSETVPLPFSFLGHGGLKHTELEIAASGRILDLILGESQKRQDAQQEEG